MRTSNLLYCYSKPQCEVWSLEGVPYCGAAVPVSGPSSVQPVSNLLLHGQGQQETQTETPNAGTLLRGKLVL
jgi:hypothetical protein